MARLLLPVLALLAACGGNKFLQEPLPTDTGDAGSDAGNGGETDADSDADADSDTDADSDADTDADSDADSDADADADGGTSTLCDNAWYPVEATGWSKEWAGTLKGVSSTGTESANGSYTSGGETIYQVRHTIATSDGAYSYDLTLDSSCDSDGEGMFLRGWSGSVNYSYEGIPLAVSATSSLSPYRKYLPPEYAVGSTGSWSYSYTLTQNYTETSSGTAFPMTTAVAGTFSEVGLEELDLMDGTTVDAYKLVNEYTLTDSTTGTATPGYIEQWWVKGLGLVKEVHTQDGADFETKELVSYAGLTIIP